MRLLLALAVSAALAVGVYLVVAETGPSTPHVATEWSSTKPADEGIDADALEKAVRSIQRESGSVLAVVVARHGRLVLERYLHGFDPDYPFDVYSITKSVTSMLVGIAVGEGRIRSIDEQLGRSLGADMPPGADPRLRRITLRQLLTMTAGFPGDADRRNEVGDPPNLVRALLRRPLVRPAGSFAYDTPSAHLLSAVLSRATEQAAGTYAERRLFRPLGIRLDDYWPRDGQGVTFGGTGLSLTARDAAKLGQLYLDGGRWAGRQLVPRKWVEKSTRAQVELEPGHGYGYLWWTSGRRGLDSYEALGFGGQMVAVVPKLDLVVVVMSNASGAAVDLGGILYDRIIPAVDG